ncbi:hypothetical protein GCM10009117_09620 [Gangjinia marincola]|uniref:CshA domain-containing protein n=1 Tax=Gangjinia marincola TaxID=578463 RepID=A0ABN1MF88_9FLAO
MFFVSTIVHAEVNNNKDEFILFPSVNASDYRLYHSIIVFVDTDGDGNDDSTDPNPNDAVANDDFTNGAAQTAKIVDVLLNDDFLANSDPNNQGTTEITVLATSTASGSITIDNNTGEIIYVAPLSEIGAQPTIDYRVTNIDTGVFAEATLTISVNVDTDGDGNPDDSDDNPNAAVANDDNANATPEVTKLVDVLLNDDFLANSDDNNLGTTVITDLGSGSAAGTIDIDNDTGEVAYTPTIGEENTGNITIDYRVENVETGVFDTATIIFNVGERDTDGDGAPDSIDLNPNSAVAQDDFATVQPLNPSTIDILLNDDYLGNDDTENVGTTDVSLDPAGTTTAQGDIEFDDTTGELTYTALPVEENTIVIVAYEVCNTQTNVCATAVVEITVGLEDTDGDGNPDGTDQNPNEAVAEDDLATASPLVTAAVDVLLNDDFLSNTNPNNQGDTQITDLGTGSAQGNITILNDIGEILYVPLTSEVNTTVCIDYQVTNALTGVFATATLCFDVVPANPDTDGDGNPDDTDPNPNQAIANDDFMNTDVGVETTIDILANDNFLPNDSPINVGTTEITDLGTGDATGTISFNNDTGEFTYTAPNDEDGSVVTVDYQVCNIDTNVCATATIFITVGVIDTDGDGNPDDNDPNPTDPVAQDDTIDVEAGDSVTADILANDDFLDNDDPINVGTTDITDLETGSAGGTVTFNNNTGEITYESLFSEANLTVTVNYQVCNTETNICATATIFINVQDTGGGANDPIAVDDTVTNQTVGDDVVVNVLANDSDPDGDLAENTVNITTAGATDTDSDGDNDTLVVAGQGTWAVDDSTGETTFTPEAGYEGDPTPITYNVSDEAGNTSNQATVTIDYNNDGGGANDPIAVDDTVTNQTVGDDVVVNVLANDSDPDGDLAENTVNITTAGATDTDSDGDNDALVVAGQGTWTVDDSTGEITFTPEAGYEGDPTPITYNVSDEAGNTSNEAAVTIDYDNDGGGGSNDPIAVDDNVTDQTIGDVVVVDVLENDSDPDGDLDERTVEITTTGATDSDNDGDNDSLVITGEGTWSVDDESGEITFTPQGGFLDDPTSITYTVSDEEGNESNEATVSIDYDNDNIDNLEVRVFNVITPNMDGENDFFLIENIENFTNDVQIYNRWGVLVYDANGYNNSSVRFDGVSDGRATLNEGDELPVGTYFYLINYSGNNLSDQLSGYLYLTR